MPLLLLTALLIAQQSASGHVRNTWAAEYATGEAAAFASRFEEPTRTLFRYRAAMAGMMQIKPGMQVGEVGAGSGYLARFIAEKVGPEGHVYANELEPKMVAYMKAEAARGGLTNFTAVQGTATSAGFRPGSLDAVAAVYALSFFDHPEPMMASMHASLGPGGVLLIVDIPSEQSGSTVAGLDAEDVERLAERAGFVKASESGVVPGHYALIFRKK